MESKKKFLRLCEVLDICGLSRSSCYSMMKSGQFPGNLKISARSVRWDSDEVYGWVADRINARSVG